jgi:hypothetical protein
MDERQRAKNFSLKIDLPSDPHYSIVQAARMKGKTIEEVEFGFREKIEGVHGSEALIIHFTDGSIRGLYTGSNASSVCGNDRRPENFHVDFMVQWVPETYVGVAGLAQMGLSLHASIHEWCGCERPNVVIPPAADDLVKLEIVRTT